MNDLDYAFFQRKVLDLTGIDLSSYKSDQMRRRLNALATRSGARNLFEYYRIISRDPAKRQEFRDFVTINVSEFFRIPEKFEYLRQYVLPELLRERRRLNVWSAGCSNGAEPYSLAIILDQLAPTGDWRILATDIDTTILQRARCGVYASCDVRNLDKHTLAKYFVPAGEQVRVIDRIKSRVQFKMHDLLRDEYQRDFDLIVCRHVIIYFTEVAKDCILRKFNDSLRPGGVLFVGGTEMLKRPGDLGYNCLAVSFYVKPRANSSVAASCRGGTISGGDNCGCRLGGPAR